MYDTRRSRMKKAGYGIVWYGMVWYGMVWYGMVGMVGMVCMIVIYKIKEWDY